MLQLARVRRNPIVQCGKQHHKTLQAQQGHFGGEQHQASQYTEDLRSTFFNPSHDEKGIAVLESGGS